MTFTTPQGAWRCPVAGVSVFGFLLLAACWLLPADGARAQEVLAQSGSAGSDLNDPRQNRLDPWNIEIREGPQWDPRNAPPQLQPRAKRHVEFIQAGVPVEYRSQRNPYPSVDKAIDAGRKVYQANCMACHGPRGRGDGDAGLDLLPSPALLTQLTKEQGAADEYLLWTISEGGKVFQTAMPAFKGRLPEDQIWQVISFLRAGLPPQ